MAEPTEQLAPAYETYGYLGQGPLVLTCEHANNRVPPPLEPDEGDLQWLETHWGYDIGARTVTRELCRLTGSYAVMARFSRLVCDANRPPDHSEFIRSETEGRPLAFNRRIDEAETRRRIEAYFDPFHQAVDHAVAARSKEPGDVLILSVHSFTPVWNFRVRTMDMGVLFNSYDAVAKRFQTHLNAEGFVTALNEPYSAKDGLVYSVERHGQAHNMVYLELEINQSLVSTPVRARKVAKRIGNALLKLKLRSQPRKD